MANVVKVIKGAAKAAKLAKRINTSAAKGRQIGSPRAYVNAKGKLKVQEYMTGKPVKGNMRTRKDNAQMIELNAGTPKGVKKITSLKYPSKSYRGIKGRTDKPDTPKVPAKKKKK